MLTCALALKKNYFCLDHVFSWSLELASALTEDHWPWPCTCCPWTHPWYWCLRTRVKVQVAFPQESGDWQKKASGDCSCVLSCLWCLDTVSCVTGWASRPVKTCYSSADVLFQNSLRKTSKAEWSDHGSSRKWPQKRSRWCACNSVVTCV